MRVTLEKLTKKFGALAALDELTLELPAGQIVALVGLNGAGKTTLLRCLAGLVGPTRGAVLYDGERFERRRLDLRRRLFFLPDFPVFYGHLSPLEHAALVLRLYEREAPAPEALVLEMLRDFDLLPLAERSLSHLSRGQIYKAALAALIAVQPELWLLDEPFASGMDPQGLAAFKARARAAANDGATILYTTQILELAERFADRLVVIDHGRLREDLSRATLDTLPRAGPESLEARLQQLRAPTPSA